MNKVFKIGIICLFISILYSVCFISSFAMPQKEKVLDENRINEDTQAYELTPVLLTTPYLITEDIKIELETNAFLKNVKRNIESNCFDNFSFEFIDFRIFLTMKYMNNLERGYLKLNFYLENNDFLSTTIYSYYTKFGLFFSFSNNENIEGLVWDYKLDQNIITEEEYNQGLDKNSFYCIENRMSNINQEEIVTQSNSTEVMISGNWFWQDNLNQSHPAQFFLVELYVNNKNVSFSYTDIQGYYEFHYSIDKTAEYFVRIVSAGMHVKVRKDSFSKLYFVDSSKFNLAPNESYKSESILLNSTIDGRAMSIAQALIIGTKYVEEMNESTLSVLYADCLYPRSRSCYGRLGIELEQEVWEFWDIALHEYGHAIQEYYYISDSPGGNHSDSEDLIELHGKDKGTRLAWGEGWPSFFAIIVTKHFADSLQGIPRINDETYDIFLNKNGMIDDRDFHLEDNNNPCFGEGSEVSIARFFYDIYDPPRTVEYWDRICIPEKELWNIVTQAQVSNFSEYFEFFMNHYEIDDIESLGEILSRCRFSAFNLKVSNWVIGRRPILTWEYIRPENTQYKLYIYNQNDYLEVESPLLNTTSYELSENDWTKVLNFPNSIMKWRVIVYQNDVPTTGGYMSYTDVRTLPQPIEIKECGIYNGKILYNNADWYKFIADDSAEYTFESFGDSDTVIETFSLIAGNQSFDYLLHSDDDSGEDYNFKITLKLTKNQILLFRIRISGWESLGDYRLSITKSSHIHDYSYRFTKYDNSTHYAYCSCGEYIMENHNFIPEKLGHRCTYCKYYTEGPVPGVLMCLNQIIMYDKKNE